MGLGFFDGNTHRAPFLAPTDGATIVGSSRRPEVFRWSEKEGVIGIGPCIECGGRKLVGFLCEGSFCRWLDDCWVKRIPLESGVGYKEAFRWTESGGGQGLGVLPE